MFISSFNIHGLWSRIKKKNVKYLIVWIFLQSRRLNLVMFMLILISLFRVNLCVIGVFSHILAIVVASFVFCVVQRNHLFYLFLTFIPSVVSKRI